MFFGAIPDLSSFGIYFFYKLIASPTTIKFGPPPIDEIPAWVKTLYDISHSMIIAIIFIMLVYVVKRDLCFSMLAWPFHIILDFFTHEIDYFATPIFWPIHDFKFDVNCSLIFTNLRSTSSDISDPSDVTSSRLCFSISNLNICSYLSSSYLS